MQDGWEAVLFDADGLPLDQWIAGGKAAVVRAVGRRCVYRVEIADGDGGAEQGREGGRFYVKKISTRGLLGTIKNLLRGSAARREWINAQEAMQRGVSTAVPIAWGERNLRIFSRDSFFISEEIPDAAALDRFVADMNEELSPKERRARRYELIREMARFTAHLHEVGLLHDDFHAGNFLVQTQQGRAGGPRIFLIDLAAVRFVAPLFWPQSRNNLVVLNAEWTDRTTSRERLQFCRTYLRERSKTLTVEQSAALARRSEMMREIDIDSREYSRRIDRGRDRRAMRTNRDFYTLKRTCDGAGQGGATTWIAHAVADFPREELEKLLAAPDALIDDNLHRPIKLGHSSLMVRAVFELSGGPREVSYKQCRSKNRWKAFCNRFRSGRAVRAWRLGHAFLSRGIATPRPIVVCRRRRSLLDKPWRDSPSYIASQWIEGAVNLHLWAWSLNSLPPDERLSRAARCAASIGRLVGRMHARRISHGDLKGSNVLILDGQSDAGGQSNAGGRSLQVFLLDLDAAIIHKRLPRRRQVADLARLATSLAAHSWADRSLWRHFWRAYEGEFPRGAIDRKPLWRAIANRRRKLLGKKKERGETVL